MVTTPSKQSFPSAATPEKARPKIDPPIQVGGKTNETSLPQGAYRPPTYRQDAASPKADVVNKDHNASFKLPEKVSQSEIRDQSFRYGGGRSAGNRSIAENIGRKVDEK